MKIFSNAMLMIGATILTPSAHAATLDIVLDEAVGLGNVGTLGNTIVTRQLGANAWIKGISYTATLTTFSPYWLRDQNLVFGTSNATQVNLQPGYDSLYSGTELFSGSVDLTQLGLDFFLEEDGILNLEFYDNWNTGPEATGAWSNVRLSLDYQPSAMAPVPEPDSWAMLIIGMAAIGGSLRCRRRPIASMRCRTPMAQS